MKLPSFQFYPGDWKKDANLARASLEARGALIEILIIAFECEKRGVLQTNGKPWTIREIAQAIPGDTDKNEHAICELIALKVLKKDRKNAIYSSRMCKDEKIRKVRRKAGLKGGNPNLVKQIVKQNPTPSSSSSSSSSSSVIQTKEIVWKGELKKDKHFLEQTCMAWYIDLEILSRMIDEFSALNGKEHKDYPDFKSHFFNWGRAKKKEKYKLETNSKLQNLD